MITIGTHFSNIDLTRPCGAGAPTTVTVGLVVPAIGPPEPLSDDDIKRLSEEGRRARMVFLQRTSKMER